MQIRSNGLLLPPYAQSPRHRSVTHDAASQAHGGVRIRPRGHQDG